MLGEKFGKPLFEMRPDLFPFNRITRLEMEVWALHFKDQQKRMK